MAATLDISEIELFKNDYNLLGDFFDFFCGKCLGSGTARIVYEFRLDPKCVIKIDRVGDFGKYTFSNMLEWEMYYNIKAIHPKVAEFLCPVVQISKCGKVLLMKKTTPIPHKSMLPKKLPDMFSDTKIENWGMLNGKVVCHDYANSKLFNMKETYKMVTANWWSSCNQAFFD